jgi:hypothetical protein
MANEPYLSAKFRVWAEFERTGITFDDVISVSASFALNTIPTASLVVAVGVNAVTGEPATIHDARTKLQPRDKVKVKIEILPGAGDTEKLAPGTYTVFDGFFIGIGYQRSENQANYTLSLVHWADDLNNSSAINGNWFPGVPHDYAQQALIDIAMPGVGAAADGSPICRLDKTIPTYDNATKDVWELVLKPMLTALANFAGRVVQTPGTQDASNNAALEAFKRMPGDGEKYYKKLALSLDGGLSPANFELSFTSYLGQSLNDSLAQNSFWAKIVAEYSGQFLFALSPAVDWVLPIPFCAGLRWTAAAKTIKATDYNYASFNANMSQIIESVDILYPYDSMTGAVRLADSPPATRPSYYKPAASFPKLGDRKGISGLRLFKNTPDWVAKLSSTAALALAATTERRSTAAANPGGETAGDLESVDEAYKKYTPIVEKYAKHFYLTEVLQQRYGELSGPLRFDIAPGSIVKIFTPARDRALGVGETEFVVASVISVSYVINAERAIAGTSFAIAHTKIEKELQSDLYSAESPPLYKEAWYGGPLAEKE